MQPLSRSAFAARMFFLLGTILALALGTLNFETAGGAAGYSTPVAVVLMGICLLAMLAASYQRAVDFGAPALGGVLLAIGSMMFFPFVTLVLLFVPSAASGGRADARPGKPTGPFWVLVSLPLGVVCGLALLFLTQAIFRAL